MPTAGMKNLPVGRRGLACPVTASSSLTGAPDGRNQMAYIGRIPLAGGPEHGFMIATLVPCQNSHNCSELVFSVSVRLLSGTR
jgi:hypothetical protein